MLQKWIKLPLNVNEEPYVKLSNFCFKWNWEMCQKENQGNLCKSYETKYHNNYAFVWVDSHILRFKGLDLEALGNSERNVAILTERKLNVAFIVLPRNVWCH